MSNPVNRLVIYRPKAGHADQLLTLLKKHAPVLREVGLLGSKPIELYRASDLSRGGPPTAPYFIEIFQWKDQAASGIAHETPAVMNVWETMGPHIETMTLTDLEPI